MAQPRIAVIGGGIAGSLCSLVLKNRGLNPIILDAGKRQLGGRLSSGGCQFLRVTDPRMAPVMGMLQNAGILQEWKARRGLLGSSGGGFLPAEVVASLGSRSGNSPGGVMGLSPSNAGLDSVEAEESAGFTDGGDFCNLVQGSGPMFVGVPSNADLCQQICDLANIEQLGNCRVSGASMVIPEGGWQVDISDNEYENQNTTFDAMVVATHDPSLAAGIVGSIVTEELRMGKFANIESVDDPQLALLLKRLNELSNKLQHVRDTGRRPLFSVTVEYPHEIDSLIPFDAVSVPGSQLVQYLGRETSNLGASQLSTSRWTAISTSQLASDIMSQENWSADDQRTHAGSVMTSEVAHLLGPFVGTKGMPIPSKVTAKRWSAALSQPGLGLKEDSITLAQWRLAICGDYIRDGSATPFEAAALSGLEAGERISSLFLGERRS